MKVATILPTKYLWIEAHRDYHLCLAHLLVKDPEYTRFFQEQARKEGAYVIMDNGVVETGEAMPIDDLIALARIVGVQEMILPDVLLDRKATLELSRDAMLRVERAKLNVNLMAVPQGHTQEEWIECFSEMVYWSVECLGISRFLVPRIYPDRTKAMLSVLKYLNSSHSIKKFHILGCPGNPDEIRKVKMVIPDSNMIRGTDSGIAAIYTQEGLEARSGCAKPDVELDFSANYYQENLLARNLDWWWSGLRGPGR